MYLVRMDMFWQLLTSCFFFFTAIWLPGYTHVCQWPRSGVDNESLSRVTRVGSFSGQWVNLDNSKYNISQWSLIIINILLSHFYECVLLDLLKSILVLFWWQRCGKKKLEEIQSSENCHIKGTQQRAPLIQHLLSRIHREISEKMQFCHE